MLLTLDSRFCRTFPPTSNHTMKKYLFIFVLTLHLVLWSYCCGPLIPSRHRRSYSRSAFRLRSTKLPCVSFGPPPTSPSSFSLTHTAPFCFVFPTSWAPSPLALALPWFPLQTSVPQAAKTLFDKHPTAVSFYPAASSLS